MPRGREARDAPSRLARHDDRHDIGSRRTTQAGKGSRATAWKQNSPRTFRYERPCACPALVGCSAYGHGGERIRMSTGSWGRHATAVLAIVTAAVVAAGCQGRVNVTGAK